MIGFETTLNSQWFAMVEDDEVFDPSEHARNDYQIRNARMVWESEDDFWKFTCDIVNPGGGFFKAGARRRLFWSEDVLVNDVYVTKLRFVGHMLAPPIGAMGEFIPVEFQSRPRVMKDGNGNITSDADAVVRAVIGSINDDPWFLYTKPEDLGSRKPEQILAARALKMNWGRLGQAPVATSVVFGNSQVIEVGEKYVRGTLKYGKPSSPLERVDVKVEAEWDQVIAQRVRIEDFTGNDAIFGTLGAAGWPDFPDFGDKVGDWTVTAISLKPTSQDYTGYYAVRTEKNRSLQVEKVDKLEDDNNATPEPKQKTLRFGRFFYDLDLELAGIQTIKRREEVTFSVVWAGQDLAEYDAGSTDINLKCQDLRREDSIPDWQQGATYGNLARVKDGGAYWQCKTPHVAGASLYQNLANWEPLMVDGTPVGGAIAGFFFGQPATISAQNYLGHVQTVTRNPIPGLSGLRYAFNQAVAKLAGANRIPLTFEVPWELIQDVTGAELIHLTGDQVLGGSCYGKVTSVDTDFNRATVTIACTPGRGLSSPTIGQPTYYAKFPPFAGIVSTQIINNSTQQEAFLNSLPQPYTGDISEALRSVRTRFTLQMTPLDGETKYEVGIPMGNIPWYGPKQIDLEAE